MGELRSTCSPLNCNLTICLTRYRYTIIDRGQHGEGDTPRDDQLDEAMNIFFLSVWRS